MAEKYTFDMIEPLILGVYLAGIWLIDCFWMIALFGGWWKANG